MPPVMLIELAGNTTKLMAVTLWPTTGENRDHE
jgi:hypothetical protein